MFETRENLGNLQSSSEDSVHAWDAALLAMSRWVVRNVALLSIPNEFELLGY